MRPEKEIEITATKRGNIQAAKESNHQNKKEEKGRPGSKSSNRGKERECVTN